MKIRLRDKLILLFFTFGIFILSASYFALVGFSVTEITSRTKLFIATSLLVCLIACLSYLLSITYCRRLEQLAKQAQSDANGDTIILSGRWMNDDELHVLAEIINELKHERIKGEELRNQLAADAAHELRTPISILRGHLESMLNGAIPLDKKHLYTLLDETRRMSKLIHDMQDLSLAEAGKLHLERSWVSLGSMLEEIVSILSIQAESKSIAIHLSLNSDGEIYCDASRIKQVFINLLGNAIRYTQRGGLILINASTRNDCAVVALSDNGPGIAPESIPYLFKRFYRVEGSRNRQSGGTGLGLAIVKQFIELHEGTVHVVSEADAGTTFTVTLPVYPTLK